MKTPPDFLLSLLYDIEQTVIAIYKEFPKLIDKDVEYVYDQLANYFKKIDSGKDLEEPTSSSTRKQALIDEILNTIDQREEDNLDASYIKSDAYKIGLHQIPSLEYLYVICFKQLSQSTRLWRKRNGKTGYLRFIIEQVPM